MSTAMSSRAWVKVVLKKRQFYSLLCSKQQWNELISLCHAIHPSTGTEVDLLAEVTGKVTRDELGPVWKFEAQLHLRELHGLQPLEVFTVFYPLVNSWLRGYYFTEGWIFFCFNNEQSFWVVKIKLGTRLIHFFKGKILPPFYNNFPTSLFFWWNTFYENINIC